MDSGMGAMENGRGLARIKHAEGAGVIEAVIRLGRAGVFDTEVARQPQGTFIDQGRGTGCAELRIGIRRNCQIATFVDVKAAPPVALIVTCSNVSVGLPVTVATMSLLVDTDEASILILPLKRADVPLSPFV